MIRRRPNLSDWAKQACDIGRVWRYETHSDIISPSKSCLAVTNYICCP